MLQTTPFLLFDGDCAAAMTFYHECLGGELTLTKLADTPMKAQFPAEKHGRIIYSRLKSGSVDISAVDWMSDQVTPVRGNMVSIYVVGTDDELKKAFDKLSKGARQDATFQELHQMPFGTFGQCTDSFGVGWFFKGDA